MAQPNIPEHEPLWNTDEVPTESQSEFKNKIQRIGDSLSDQDYSFRPDHPSSSWLGPPNHDSYASFGDGGVTASVNIYGDLMQFSAHLGAGTTGMFCADHLHTSKPYDVENRMKDLYGLAGDRERKNLTYGLRILGLGSEQPPHLTYVFDRWPKYEFSSNRFKVDMQWMVHDQILLQQCVFRDISPSEQNILLDFATGIHIRDLNHLDGDYHFNDTWAGHASLRAPNDYGWILLNRFEHCPSTEDQRCERTASSNALARENLDNTLNGQGPSLSDPIDHSTSSAKEPYGVALLVSLFHNGKAMRWNPMPRSGRQPSNADSTNASSTFLVPVEGRDTIEVIVAYRMLLLPMKDSNDWTKFLISPTAADVRKHLAESSSTFQRFTASNLSPETQDSDSEQARHFSIQGLPKDWLGLTDYMDFFAMRNLEHILSVCAIPVESASGGDGAVATALTCGDMSGHRLCSSASYYAFKFLLEVAKRLRASAEPERFILLLRRIEQVCRGHLKWLSRYAQTESGCFAANYWVNGQLMVLPADSWSFMPKNSITDTAFQILKFHEFLQVFDTAENRVAAQNAIGKIAESWMELLDRTDTRRVYAWSHAKSDGCNKYRLSIHVWIWMALKAIHEIFPKHLRTNPHADKIRVGSSRVPNIEERPRAKEEYREDLYARLDPNKVQGEVLRRFTTENSMSGKRMLAMTRSTRQTRFLLHASDTAVLYGVERGFLPDPSTDEMWENTLESQVHHQQNSELLWDNLMRYTLAIMVGAMHKRLNKRTSEDLVKSSLNVLFQATSSNGLFFGQIDETTKRPTSFWKEAEKDFHFHVCFEIPFILITQCAKIYAVLGRKEDRKGVSLRGTSPDLPTRESSEDSSTIERTSREKEPQLDKRKPTHSNNNDQLVAKAVMKTGPAVVHGITAKARQPHLKFMAMKKSMPFNSLIDQSSIVEMEEEWLYNYPSFLSRDYDIDWNHVDSQLTKYAANNAEDEGDESVIRKAAVDLKIEMAKQVEATENSNKFKNSLRKTPDITDKLWVVDIPRQKQLRKPQKQHASNDGNLRKMCHNNWELWEKLCSARTAIEAKKRLIWLPSSFADCHESALICFLTTEEVEQPSVSSFFDRHFHNEKSFTEETNMALNLWQTELNLSFYRIATDGTKTIPKWREQATNTSVLPSSSIVQLYQTSTGFRFYGDFFDRHWTCYYMECPLNSDERKPRVWFEPEYPLGCWRQRKVLELVFFNRIINEVTENTEEILSKVQDHALARFGIVSGDFSFSRLKNDVYFSYQAEWQESQQILHVLDEELSEVLRVLQKWEAREKDRGHERPRWTRNDERKYRPFINKLEGFSRRLIGDLVKCHGKVQLLKRTLVSGQEQSLKDLDRRGAEDIRLFTYVTIIFLPLGFSASIFSMNGTPTSPVVRNMVVCAFVALALTAFALLLARQVNQSLTTISLKTSPFWEDRTQNNQPDDRPGSQAAQLETATNVETSPVPQPTYKHSASFTWKTMQLFKFILLEFPARRVLVACYSVQNPQANKLWLFFHIALGVLLVPVFLVTYVLQVVAYNAVDFAQICTRHAKNWREFFTSGHVYDEVEFEGRLQRLLAPPKKSRLLA